MKPTLITLVSCLYNSNEQLLDRLLRAVSQFEVPHNTQVEYILIDNASSHPMAEQATVKSFMQEAPFPTQVIVESQPGLTFARICGIKAAKGQFIIFFDDDNEPASDYLTQAITLMEAFPFVGIWGPGTIKAELLGKVPATLENHYKYTFQEKSMPFEQYTRTIQGNEAFPLGTGMVLRREVLTPYLQAFEERKYTLTDRIGNSLASSGDTQIVLTAIKNGWAVGNAPQLKMVHIIPDSRTNIRYMKRLSFGVNSSAKKVFAEVYPEFPLPLPPNWKFFLFRLLGILAPAILRRQFHFGSVTISGYIGEVYAAYELNQKPIPWWLKGLIRYFNLI